MEFVQFLLTVLFVGTLALALIFWNQILNWADQTLFPWIKENFPGLEKYVRYAFAEIHGFVGPLRRQIKTLENFTETKKAWKMLRKYLLKVLVQFEMKTQNQWLKRITSWATREIESKEQVVRRVVEEIVDFNSLPDDVSKKWLNEGKTTQDVNVTQLRDRELDEPKKDTMSLSQ